MKTLFAFLAFLPLALQAAEPATSNAQPTSEMSATQAASPSKMLRRGVVMTFPPEIKTVLDASRYMLAPGGYRVTIPNSTQQQTAAILNRPVLSVHRNGALLPIDVALLTVAGDDTLLIVDHESKLVTFERLYK
jgi:hypothetical protein